MSPTGSLSDQFYNRASNGRPHDPRHRRLDEPLEHIPEPQSSTPPRVPSPPSPRPQDRDPIRPRKKTSQEDSRSPASYDGRRRQSGESTFYDSQRDHERVRSKNGHHGRGNDLNDSRKRSSSKSSPCDNLLVGAAASLVYLASASLHSAWKDRKDDRRDVHRSDSGGRHREQRDRSRHPDRRYRDNEYYPRENDYGRGDYRRERRSRRHEERYYY